MGLSEGVAGAKQGLPQKTRERSKLTAVSTAQHTAATSNAMHKERAALAATMMTQTRSRRK